MTLRSIDGQLIMARVPEASNVQNQLNQKPMYDQQAAAAQAMKQQELERQRSNQVDQSAEGKIRDGSDKGQDKENNRRSKKESTDRGQHAEASEHPYKGRFIDLSL